MKNCFLFYFHRPTMTTLPRINFVFNFDHSNLTSLFSAFDSQSSGTFCIQPSLALSPFSPTKLKHINPYSGVHLIRTIYSPALATRPSQHPAFRLQLSHLRLKSHTFSNIQTLAPHLLLLSYTLTSCDQSSTYQGFTPTLP